MDNLSFYSEDYYLSESNKDLNEEHNPGDSPDSLYSISAPLEITYACCSGIGDSDYINLLNLSPAASSLVSTTMRKFYPHTSRHTMHNHDYYEFMLVLEGQILYRIENKEHLYGAGCGCLINRNVRHTEVYSDAVRVLFIRMSVRFISGMIQLNTEDLFGESQQVHTNPIFQFIRSDIQIISGKTYFNFSPLPGHSKHISTLHEITELLLKTMLFPQFGASYILRGTVCRLAQYLTMEEYYNITQVQLDSREDFLLFSRITHLLEDHYGRISRRELENILNYSGSYINKVVKKYAGTSLFDYSMDFCMKRAEYLLKNTNRSVASIMSELHFTNTTHFYALFEKAYGCPPGQYRKK